ncbi:HlyD family efflux transporter periplasmic adaptor subunit [Streptomyces sp. A7024]|uniref:HlyD family efflux transporter periplasmic adaptor subunit n=1 Tax=Streptomyces coryli TaxID=1128680 RepID=A0A6G4U9A2_9ACTN|nr:peptidoglycan-binding protein [Streptomyces coryli]NGN68300.1 HlyD family efflux transporter periplasmic adaptor subunit [Streptomyces coryli]
MAGPAAKAAMTAAVLVTGGAVTAATLGLGGSSPGTAGTGDALPPATATVERQTLKDTESADGELGYGTATEAAARRPGTLTAVPAAGDRVRRGQALFRADDEPVVLLYGSTPAYRALKAGSEGRDVKQLESNLRALGYTGFTVDDEYSAATATAVKSWQEDLGLTETGAVELGRVVFAPGQVRIDSVAGAAGEAASPGQKVLSYTGTAKAVTVELDTDDQRLAKKGAEVEVRLPDGRTVTGKIAKVSTVLEPGRGDEPAETKVNVEVALPGKAARKAASAYEQAAVDVSFTAGTRKNVLTVPVAALVALAEGGFGLEVVKGGTSRYVEVTPGLFADGRVEISGGGVSAGTKVGMPT